MLFLPQLSYRVEANFLSEYSHFSLFWLTGAIELKACAAPKFMLNPNNQCDGMGGMALGKWLDHEVNHDLITSD